jgi:PGF-pre-PGF domain-containing protein
MNKKWLVLIFPIFIILIFSFRGYSDCFVSSIVCNETNNNTWPCLSANETFNYTYYFVNCSESMGFSFPEGPIISSSSQYALGKNYQFNAEVSIPSLDMVFFESNFTLNASESGILTNYTYPNVTNTSNIFTIVLTDLPAQKFVYRWLANDTGDVWSSTDILDYTIKKADNPVNLYFNGTQNSNKTYAYPSSINATATSAVGTVYFYRNGTHANNGTSPQSEEILLGSNAYPYKVNATGNENYSDNITGITYYAIINKGTLNLSINASSTSVVESTETNFTGIESNDGDNDTVYELWRDSTKIDNTTPYEDVTDQLDAGTYIYRFNSTGGENWTANLTGVTKTLTVSDTTITPSPGGGKVPSFSDIKREKGMVNMTINRIDGNTTSNFSITKTEDIAIRKLSINVLNTVSNVKLVITKLSSLPPTISHNIDGKVYHYININHENINDTDINKTIIRFAVNKTWLNDNNVNSSNISLYRWEEYRWNELPVTFFYQDAFEILYEAESPGFSVFIIGTSGGSGEISEGACTESWSCTEWSVCVNSTQTRTCTDSNDCGTTVDKPAESQECQTLMGEINIEEMPITTIVSFALLLVVVIGALIFLKTKGKLSFISKEEEDTKEEYYY